jgi:hypothetical protein
MEPFVHQGTRTTAIIDADPLSMIDGGLNGNSNIASDMTSENNKKKSTRVKRRVSWFFFPGRQKLCHIFY